MKSMYSKQHYTYSLINEAELHRFVVVVYLKPKDILKVNQTEIGRVFIGEAMMKEYQNKGKSQELVEQYIHQVIKEYESGQDEKKFIDQTKDITIQDDNGDPVAEAYQLALKKMAAQEINAEFGGYLKALGINIDTALPTDGPMTALIKKAAELKKAQLEMKSNAKSLAYELEAMKQSFKETAIAYHEQKNKPKDPYKWPKASNLDLPVPKIAQSFPYLDDYHNDEDDGWTEPVHYKKPVAKPKKKKPQKAHASFIDTERKFRND